MRSLIEFGLTRPPCGLKIRIMSRKEIPILDLVRSTLLWIILLFATLVYGILVIPFVILRMPSVVHWFARMWGKTLALLSGMRVHVRNKEKVFRNGPVIIVANHQSMFDIPVFYSFLDTEFRWMAKASLFKIPFVGWGMSGAGYIPVERGDRKKAMESLFKAAERIQAGASVIIFPEGTRSPDPDQGMLPFKKGGFVLAKKAEVHIQPVTIWGAYHIMPPKQKGKFIQRIFPGPVHVEVHDHIAPETYRDMSHDELMDLVRRVLEAPMERMKAEKHN